MDFNKDNVCTVYVLKNWQKELVSCKYSKDVETHIKAIKQFCFLATEQEILALRGNNYIQAVNDILDNKPVRVEERLY